MGKASGRRRLMRQRVARALNNDIHVQNEPNGDLRMSESQLSVQIHRSNQEFAASVPSTSYKIDSHHDNEHWDADAENDNEIIKRKVGKSTARKLKKKDRFLKRKCNVRDYSSFDGSILEMIK